MNVRQLAARVEPGVGVPPRGSPAEAPAVRDPSRASFAEELRRLREGPAPATPELHLSAHARQRLAQRGISMTDDEQQTLRDAMHQLEARGARDALLLRADAAFVVNVPTRTMVTALAQDELRDRIFTQIDSAMLV